jgi:hypothetical protein
MEQMRVVVAAIVVLVLPDAVLAQRFETSWALGTSIGTNAVVRSGANVGRLRPAFLAEFGAHYFDRSARRVGMVVQAVPFPGIRVKGTDLAGNAATRTYGTTPLLVLRLLSDVAPWSANPGFTPSFGIGYTAFIHPASGCTSGTDSPLCSTAARIHGAHGVTGQVGAAIGSPASRFSLHARYLFTRVPDMTTQDATLGIRWRLSK